MPNSCYIKTMDEITERDNFLYWIDGNGPRRAPVSVQALAALEHRGADLRPLYHYQYMRVVAARNYRYPWSLLIADEMGVGKSASAIACMVASESEKTLIVCPNNVKLQWRRVLHDWVVACPYVFVCDGLTYSTYDVACVNNAKIVVISYNLLYAWREVICSSKWDMMVCDESQRLKKSSAQCTCAAKVIREFVEAGICLSGTPLTDRNADIYNTIWMVDRTLFPSEPEFHQRYCDGFVDKFNRSSVSVNTLELHRKLVSSGVMVRATKKQVYKELPKVSVEIVPIAESNSTLEGIEKTAAKLRESADLAYGALRSRCLFQMQRSLEDYAQEAIKLKLPHIIQWIEAFLDDTDSKLIVSCVHREKCGDILFNKFKNLAVLVDGSITSKVKDEALTKFIKDKATRLLIGNIQSISAGIDGLQTVCKDLAVCELPWSPGDLAQLFARLDRNGQKDSVSIWIHTIYNSLDESRARLLDKKSNIMSEVLDGKSLESHKKLITLMGKRRQHL